MPGFFCPGRLIDRFAQRSPRVFGLLPGIALALAVPFFIGFVQAPTWPVAIAFLAVPTFLNYFYLTPAVTLVQNSVSAGQRTVAGAVLLLIMNLIGLGFGPTWVGAWSDWLRPTHPTHSLQLALYSLLPFYLIAIVLDLALAHRLARSEAAHERRAPVRLDAAVRADSGPLHRPCGQVAWIYGSGDRRHRRDQYSACYSALRERRAGCRARSSRWDSGAAIILACWHGTARHTWNVGTVQWASASHATHSIRECHMRILRR